MRRVIALVASLFFVFAEVGVIVAQQDDKVVLGYPAIRFKPASQCAIFYTMIQRDLPDRIKGKSVRVGVYLKAWGQQTRSKKMLKFSRMARRKGAKAVLLLSCKESGDGKIQFIFAFYKAWRYKFNRKLRLAGDARLSQHPDQKKQMAVTPKEALKIFRLELEKAVTVKKCSGNLCLERKLESCVGDSDCGDLEICDGSPKACKVAFCSESNACPGPRYCASDRICYTKQGEGASCSHNGQCMAGLTCKDGKCKKDAPTCSNHYECINQDNVCKDGSCVDINCVIDGACLPGSFCDTGAGKCIRKKKEGWGCSEDKQCLAGLKCTNGKCEKKVVVAVTQPPTGANDQTPTVRQKPSEDPELTTVTKPPTKKQNETLKWLGENSHFLVDLIAVSSMFDGALLARNSWSWSPSLLFGLGVGHLKGGSIRVWLSFGGSDRAPDLHFGYGVGLGWTLLDNYRQLFTLRLVPLGFCGWHRSLKGDGKSASVSLLYFPGVEAEFLLFAFGKSSLRGVAFIRAHYGVGEHRYPWQKAVISTVISLSGGFALRF